jgi:hypothetical protein
MPCPFSCEGEGQAPGTLDQHIDRRRGIGGGLVGTGEACLGLVDANSIVELKRPLKR